MPRLRCSRCGKLTTTRRDECKSCGETEHLIHCHHPKPLEKGHWKTCPEAQAHAHTYDDGDHTHPGQEDAWQSNASPSMT